MGLIVSSIALVSISLGVTLEMENWAEERLAAPSRTNRNNSVMNRLMSGIFWISAKVIIFWEAFVVRHLKFFLFRSFVSAGQRCLFRCSRTISRIEALIGLET